MRVLVNSHGSTLRFWTRLPLRLKCFATQGISRPRIFDAAQVVASEPFQTNTTNMSSTMSRITSTWLKEQTAFICAGVAMVLRSLIAVPIERADVASWRCRRETPQALAQDRRSRPHLVRARRSGALVVGAD